MLALLLYFVISVALIGFFVYWCSTRAIIFARGLIAFCLAIALAHYGYKFVPDRAFLNFVAWAIICFCALHFLSLFPRIDISTRFFCTVVVSLFVTEFAGSLIGIIFNDDTDFEITLFHEIINKVVSVGFAIFGIWTQGKKLPSESSRHILVSFVDRLVASVFYMVSIVILSLSFHEHYEVPTAVLLILVFGGLVGAYVADVFLAEKFLFGHSAAREMADL